MALTNEKLQLAEYARLRFAITPEPNETLEDVLDSKYWVHAAARLKPHSVIEVVPQDGSYYAELFVHSCDRTFARVLLLRVVVFDKEAMDAVSKAAKTPAKGTSGKSEDKGPKPIPENNKGAHHYVDWGGPQLKGRVIRLEDKQVVKHGFASIDEARSWMVTHEEENLLVGQTNATKLEALES